MYKPIILCLLIITSIWGCKPIEKQQADLLIINAQVVDIASNEVKKDQLIAIINDTIEFVDRMINYEKYSSDKVIDVNGRFVMPGLWDNHVHFRGGDSLVIENKNLLPLFLAYGVTTVRDAGGDITSSVLEWNEEIKAGVIDGPKIFTSGPKLDGPNPAWAGSLKISSSSDVTAALDSLQTLNVGYVKMYDGSLSKEMFYEIISQAETRGLKTTGHMPLSADLMKAVDMGLDGSEHMYYVLKACSPIADSLTQLHMGYNMVTPLVQTYDNELADSVFHVLGANGIYITPTLYIGNTLVGLLSVDHSKDSLLKNIGPGIQQTYLGRIERAKTAKQHGNNSREQLAQLTIEMIKPMYKAGINLLAGSDCGPFNSFVYPGESLHGELRALINAGMTPQEALTTSVINGPKFFGLESHYGKVKNGYIADLLVLNKNPLQSINNLTSINMVLRSGKSYNKSSLEKMLK